MYARWLAVLWRRLAPTEDDAIISWLILLLVLSLFRRPVAASISQFWLSPLLAVAPLLFISCLLVRWVLQSEESRFSSLPGKVGVALIVFLPFLVLAFAHQGAVKAYELSAITLSLIFPVGCYILFCEKSLTRLFESTLKIGIILAFVVTAIEFALIKFGFYSPQDIYLWLRGEYPPYQIRINTFMGLGAISGLLSLCGYAYFLSQYLRETEIGKKSDLVFAMISLSTLFLDDSFVLIIGAIVASFLILFARKNGKISLLSFGSVVIFWILIVILSIKITPFYGRFKAYFFYGEIHGLSRVWLPQFAGCDLSRLFLGIPSGNDITFNCGPGEFHGLTMVFQHGMLVCVPWFLFLISPILIYFKLEKGIRKESFPLMAGAFAYLFPFLHYSGVEQWGNNHLFELLVALMFKKLHDSRLGLPA